MNFRSLALYAPGSSSLYEFRHVRVTESATGIEDFVHK